MKLGRLTGGGRFFQFAGDDDAATDGQLLHFAGVVGKLAGGNDLQVPEAASVVDFDEAEPAFAVTTGANPSAYFDLCRDGFCLACGFDADPVAHDSVRKLRFVSPNRLTCRHFVGLRLRPQDTLRAEPQVYEKR